MRKAGVEVLVLRISRSVSLEYVLLGKMLKQDGSVKIDKTVEEKIIAEAEVRQRKSRRPEQSSQRHLRLNNC